MPETALQQVPVMSLELAYSLIRGKMFSAEDIIYPKPFKFWR